MPNSLTKCRAGKHCFGGTIAIRCDTASELPEFSIPHGRGRDCSIRRFQNHESGSGVRVTQESSVRVETDEIGSVK